MCRKKDEKKNLVHKGRVKENENLKKKLNLYKGGRTNKIHQTSSYIAHGCMQQHNN